VNSLAIQSSLTTLEDRYRELREISEKHRQAFAELRTEKDRLDNELAEVRAVKDGVERELAEVRAVKDGVERELAEVRAVKDGVEGELTDVRERSELLSLQLLQVQEELGYYFRENQVLRQEGQRKDEKLDWLRAQRESLLRMLGQQARLQQRFITLNARTALPLQGPIRP
jgi:chromosome segregation ATPase